MKCCTTCQTEKDIVDFNKNKSTKDGLHTQCKACLKEYRERSSTKKLKRAEYQRNKSKYKEYFTKNKQKRSDYMKEWRKENADKIRENKRNWSKNNRDKVNRYKRKRRDSRGLTEQEEQLVLSKFNNKCFKCGSIENLQFDHHIPLSKGGILEPSNTVLLCKVCNGRKTNLDPAEFYSKEELMKLKEIIAHG